MYLLFAYEYIISQSFGIVNIKPKSFVILSLCTNERHFIMYFPQDIANRIKFIAKQKNITMAKMFSECGLSKNTLSSMLNGGSTPKSENLAKIADYLDCSVDYLLGRTDRIQMAPDPLHVAYNNASDDVKSAVRKLLDIKQADD